MMMDFHVLFGKESLVNLTSQAARLNTLKHCAKFRTSALAPHVCASQMQALASETHLPCQEESRL